MWQRLLQVPTVFINVTHVVGQPLPINPNAPPIYTPPPGALPPPPPPPGGMVIPSVLPGAPLPQERLELLEPCQFSYSPAEMMCHNLGKLPPLICNVALRPMLLGAPLEAGSQFPVCLNVFSVASG